jgi:uncharacterized DUF497 family protein
MSIIIKNTRSYLSLPALQCSYMLFYMSSLLFEWDENKNLLNQRKHGVSFEEAKTVFADELGRLIPDPEHSDGEERFILMGISAYSRLLVVCHCERDEDAIRIISARKADKSEKRQYEGGYYA